MKRNFFAVISALLLIFFFTACENDTVPTPRTDIHLDSASATIGKHLVDKDGKTLYYFANDVNGASSCTGGCLNNWQVFYADSTATTFTDGLLASDFKTATNAAGVKQTTYKGWPLYYYAPSGVAEAARQTTGEGVGNVWFVAKPNYSITVANFQLTASSGVNYLNNYTPGDGRTNYLCDEKGNTLYFFTRDSAFKNKYTRADFSNNATWPIYETENISVPSTFDKSLFAIITVNGTKKQLTYKGWPLYYYGPDAMIRGINKGINIPTNQPVGAIWPVATKDAALAPR
jgi:predicted lipoprotein with Yx(FWY)xxD motif